MRKEISLMEKTKKVAIYGTLFIFTIILLVVNILNYHSTAQQQQILTNSIKTQLISTSLAARDIINIEEFSNYNDKSIARSGIYQSTLKQLRTLADSVGAKYIYALKEIDNEYYFIFDTDVKNDTLMDTYELSEVHKQAFEGIQSADVMNLDDEFGSFNTGCVPIIEEAKIIGIVCIDFDDQYLQKSIDTSRRNQLFLSGVLIVVMAVVLLIVSYLIKKLNELQDKMYQMAHFDSITNLPNRQYLFEYLETISNDRSKPYAIMFIDLDNFKRVNDTAGHDAGDELLREIGAFLESVGGKSFRPSAGRLNVSARVGGDEFIQVISDFDNEEAAHQFAKQVLAEFHQHINSRYIDKFGVGMSIGVALFPYHTDDYNVLIKYADIAMYNAKQAGKNQCAIYRDEMWDNPEK